VQRQQTGFKKGSATPTNRVYKGKCNANKQGLKREVQRQQTGFKKGSATPTNRA